jgi:hypothetical protein
MALAFPEDLAQEIALIDYQWPNITLETRRKLVRQKCRELEHEIWKREPTRRPRSKPAFEPSRLKESTGYKNNSAAKREARAKVSPERRREIARLGWEARFKRES